MENLKCYKCDQGKPLSEFYSIYCWWCKKCLDEYMEKFLKETAPTAYFFKARKKEFEPFAQELRNEARENKISIYSQPVVEFIGRNMGCIIEQITDEFQNKIGSRNIREILKKLIKENLIFTEGKRPKKYFILS